MFLVTSMRPYRDEYVVRRVRAGSTNAMKDEHGNTYVKIFPDVIQAFEHALEQSAITKEAVHITAASAFKLNDIYKEQKETK